MQSQKFANLSRKVCLILWGIFIQGILLGQTNYAPNEIIIKFVNPDLFAFDASASGCELLGNVDCINAEVWCIPDTLNFGDETIIGETNIANYFESFVGIVAYAQPNFIPTLFDIPNDPDYELLWGMDSINAPSAWEIETGSDDVIVGVLDTGIDWGHPDLKENIWQNLGEDANNNGTVLVWTGSQWIFDPGDQDGIDGDGNGYIDDFIGWDFYNNDNNPMDNCGHGTHVAGTIGAIGNNGIGVSGVAQNVQLMALKGFENTPFGCNAVPISTMITAWEYAITMGAKISNNSWGGTEFSSAAQNAIIVGGQNNHLFVTAAGNSSYDLELVPHYPAAYPQENIITVGASDVLDEVAVFQNGHMSNFGPESVDLFAPGSAILSTTPNNSYDYKSGTSMAAPHVAGAVALVMSHCNDLTYQATKDILLNTTKNNAAFQDKCLTNGILDIGSALNGIATNCNAELSSCLASDSLALVALYNATNGANWINTWDLFQPVNTWFGVLLNGDGCNVERVSLINNALTGFIPNEIGELQYLEYLNLGQNDLMGGIPFVIGNLFNLEVLILEANQLSGEIPIELGQLTALKNLKLINNQLGGSIPPELGALINLEILGLHINELSGSIPPEFGELVSLQQLFLNDNDLTGNVPLELGQLVNLTALSLGNNDLDGCFPTEWCDLTFNLLYLDNNSNLPDGGSDQGFQDFCSGLITCNCLMSDSLNLVDFYMATNGTAWTNTWDLLQPVADWYGVVLTSDGCSVRELNLSDNQLSGTLPLELSLFSNLVRLNLNFNDLSGDIPMELGDLIDLKYLGFYENQLSGTIPSTLGNLTNLEYLNLQSNQLSGSIPPELGQLLNLNYLRLYGNQLSGSIPAELGQLNKLIHLSLHENQLSGSIPNELGNLSNLERLYLYLNNLSGEIPPELGQLSNLNYLYLHYNNLSGTIPEELGNLSNLEYLWLRDNQFSGNYPSGWCSLNFILFECKNNPDLIDGGLISGFETYCEEINACNDFQSPIAQTIDLGTDQNIGCGDILNLTTGLENMLYTVWDYEGKVIATDTNAITTALPGMYTVVVADLCNNIGVDTIEILETEDCVWPGDVNKDNVVNYQDVLFWGLEFGETGPPRTNASFDWIGQSANNWVDSNNGLINSKHADTDGNGLVDDADLQVINLNYEEKNGTFLNIDGVALDAAIGVNANVLQSDIGEGYFFIDIILENTIEDVHGLSWSVDLEGIEASNVSFIYNDGWFGTDELNVKSYARYSSVYDKIDIAITRTDGQNVSGLGNIGYLAIEEDNVGSWDDSLINLSVSINNPVMIRNDGDLFNLNNNTESLSINSPIYTNDLIYLKPGWNLISLDVVLEDKSIAEVFSSLQTNNLKFVTGFDNGAVVYDPNIPAVLNTLSAIQAGYGYWVKVDSADTLEVAGLQLNEEFRVPFNAGWNLLAYPPESPNTPLDYYSDLISQANLLFITGFDNGALVYDPVLPAPLNTLQEMRNGFGYWVKVGTAYAGKTTDAMELSNVFGFYNGTSNLAAGEEVQIRTKDSYTVAIMEVLQGGYLMTTPVYGDDLVTETIEGISVGEELVFVWREQTIEMGAAFTGNLGIEKVDLTFDINFNLVESYEHYKPSFYPNPATDFITIALPDFLHNEPVIKVYDEQGKLILLRKQTVDTSAFLDITSLKSGIYTVNITSDKESFYTRFVKY